MLEFYGLLWLTLGTPILAAIMSREKFLTAIRRDEPAAANETYFAKKLRICQEYVKKELPPPYECIQCEDDPKYAPQCEAWRERGYCDLHGIMIQVCAKTCGTCLLSPGYPALYDSCKDDPDQTPLCANFQGKSYWDCRKARVERVCAETCGFCKQEIEPGGTTKCAHDAAFIMLPEYLQFGLACGCFGLDPNAFSHCCADLVAHHNIIDAFPEGGGFDCHKMTTGWIDSDLVTVREPGDSYFERKQCCNPNDCGDQGDGYGCACSDPQAPDQDTDNWYSMVCSTPICAPRCAWGVKMPPEPGPAPDRPPIDTIGDGCCSDSMCGQNEHCLCGRHGAMYYECSRVVCQGRCKAN